MADVLVYLGGSVLVLWGVSHLAPTRRVAASFGAIGVDNRRILVMEWVAEGLTHVSLGALVVLVAALVSDATAGALVYRVCAAALLAIAALTAVTGSRTPVVWFRACPFVLSGTAALLLAASAL